jgi:membrane protease YdiL (CAAX protease family)
MAFDSTAIRAYFDEADYGNNHWGAWAAGIWFTMVIWIIGQLIVGIPMIIGIFNVDPNFMENMPQPKAGGQLQSMALPAFFLTSLLALVMYFIRHNFSNQRTPLSIAGFFALISTACVIIFVQSNDPESSAILMSYIGKSKLVYASMLLIFPIVAIGIWTAQKVLHKRSLRSLHTAAGKYRWGRMFFSMLVFWLIAGALSYISHSTGQSPAEFVFDPARFWGFALISLLLIPLQSATEEIVLRGYLNQGLSRIIASPWIIFLITSAGFAALHLGNPEMAQGAEEGSKLITLSGYFFFGFFACILTYIDGGLETAIGVHAANNLYASMIMGYDHSALPTPTIFKIGFNSDADVLMTLIGLSLVCAVMYVTRSKISISQS